MTRAVSPVLHPPSTPSPTPRHDRKLKETIFQSLFFFLFLFHYLPSIINIMLQNPPNPLFPKIILLRDRQLVRDIRMPNHIPGIFQTINRPEIRSGESPLETIGIEIINETRPAGTHEPCELKVTLGFACERIDAAVGGIVAQTLGVVEDEGHLFLKKVSELRSRDYVVKGVSHLLEMRGANKAGDSMRYGVEFVGIG